MPVPGIILSDANGETISDKIKTREKRRTYEEPICSFGN